MAAKKVKKIKKVVKKAVKRAPKVSKIPKPEINKIDDKKAYELVKSVRVPVVKYFFCKKEKELPGILKKIGYPCVMKVSGREIVHKTDIDGVIKNIYTPPALDKKHIKAAAQLLLLR